MLPSHTDAVALRRSLEHLLQIEAQLNYSSMRSEARWRSLRGVWARDLHTAAELLDTGEQA